MCLPTAPSSLPSFQVCKLLPRIDVKTEVLVEDEAEIAEGVSA